MTAPRIIVPGATFALTRRTTLRKAFLGPWDPMVDQAFLYCLADAQEETDVEIHHAVEVLTHHHTSGTARHDNLPEFVRRFHRELSGALNTLLERRKYDAPGEIFDDRQAHIMRLVDAEAQMSQLVYEFLNPPAAGLVRRPEDMPGTTLDFDLWKVGYIEVERPDFYFSKSRPKVLRLRLTPPPELYRAFDGDLDRLVYHMKRLSEDGLRAIHAEQRGPVVGARKLKSLHPWMEPRTMRERGDDRIPTFRIGATGLAGKTARIEAAKEVHAFRMEHHECLEARRQGDVERRFPFGTYAMRVHQGAPVEPEPPEGCIVAMPGATLEEVKVELEQERRDRAQVREDSHALVDKVREALRAEAGDIVDEETMDLTEPTPVRSKPDAADDDEQATSSADRPSPAVVRHRFDKRRSYAARRLITLRDRRRGRPPRGSGPHGSDPPH